MRLFIYFNIIGIQIFCIDNAIKKAICLVFYAYIFNFIIYLMIYIINIYLCHEMVINVFFLLYIFSDNSKY